MVWGLIKSGFDAVGDWGGDQLERVVEWGGEKINEGLDWGADQARRVGLDGAADFLDDAGDVVASTAGGQVPEKELGETEDKEDLIRGRPADINERASKLTEFGDNFTDVSNSLSNVSASQWQGETADQFRAQWDKQPPLWNDAAAAMTTASSTLSTWADEVTSAQARAQEAIDKWRRAEELKAEYERQREQYDSLDSDAQADTPTPVDRSEALFEEARDDLRRARSDRDNAAGVASAALEGALENAPEEPPFTDRLGADLSDLSEMMNDFGVNVTSGLLKGAGGIVQFVRQVNPADPYNMRHPGKYSANLIDMGSGLLVVAADPGDALNQMWTEFKANPGEGTGRILSEVLFDVATGGAGRAASSAARVSRVLPDGAGGTPGGGSPSGLLDGVDRSSGPSAADPVSRDTADASSRHVDLPSPDTRAEPIRSGLTGDSPGQLSPGELRDGPAPVAESPSLGDTPSDRPSSDPGVVDAGPGTGDRVADDSLGGVDQPYPVGDGPAEGSTRPESESPVGQATPDSTMPTGTSTPDSTTPTDSGPDGPGTESDTTTPSVTDSHIPSSTTSDVPTGSHETPAASTPGVSSPETPSSTDSAARGDASEVDAGPVADETSPTAAEADGSGGSAADIADDSNAPAGVGPDADPIPEGPPGGVTPDGSGPQTTTETPLHDITSSEIPDGTMGHDGAVDTARFVEDTDLAGGKDAPIAPIASAPHASPSAPVSAAQPPTAPAATAPTPHTAAAAQPSQAPAGKVTSPLMNTEGSRPDSTASRPEPPRADQSRSTPEQPRTEGDRPGAAKPSEHPDIASGSTPGADGVNSPDVPDAQDAAKPADTPDAQYVSGAGGGDVPDGATLASDATDVPDTQDVRAGSSPDVVDTPHAAYPSDTSDVPGTQDVPDAASPGPERAGTADDVRPAAADADAGGGGGSPADRGGVQDGPEPQIVPAASLADGGLTPDTLTPDALTPDAPTPDAPTPDGVDAPRTTEDIGGPAEAKDTPTAPVVAAPHGVSPSAAPSTTPLATSTPSPATAAPSPQAPGGKPTSPLIHTETPRPDPNVTRPDPSRPESSRPESSRPESSRPDQPRPTPDQARPDGERPGATKPVRPDAPATGRPDAPGSSKPDTSSERFDDLPPRKPSGPSDPGLVRKPGTTPNEFTFSRGDKTWDLEKVPDRPLYRPDHEPAADGPHDPARIWDQIERERVQEFERERIRLIVDGVEKAVESGKEIVDPVVARPSGTPKVEAVFGPTKATTEATILISRDPDLPTMSPDLPPDPGPVAFLSVAVAAVGGLKALQIGAQRLADFVRDQLDSLRNRIFSDSPRDLADPGTGARSSDRVDFPAQPTRAQLDDLARQINSSDEHGRQCADGAEALRRGLSGEQVEVPPTRGADYLGMSVEEFLDRLGADEFRRADADSLSDTLDRLGDRSSATVIGRGADGNLHAVTVTRAGDDLVVVDPSAPEGLRVTDLSDGLDGYRELGATYHDGRQALDADDPRISYPDRSGDDGHSAPFRSDELVGTREENLRPTDREPESRRDPIDDPDDPPEARPPSDARDQPEYRHPVDTAADRVEQDRDDLARARAAGDPEGIRDAEQELRLAEESLEVTVRINDPDYRAANYYEYRSDTGDFRCRVDRPDGDAPRIWRDEHGNFYLDDDMRRVGHRYVQPSERTFFPLSEEHQLRSAETIGYRAEVLAAAEESKAARPTDPDAASEGTRSDPNTDDAVGDFSADEYPHWQHSVSQVGEFVGDLAADHAMISKYADGVVERMAADGTWETVTAETLSTRMAGGLDGFTPTGSDRFDAVYRVTTSEGPHIEVVEAKGPHAGFGSRMADGVRYGQGTAGYFEALLRKDNALMEAIGVTGREPVYSTVRAVISERGFQGSVRNVFDLE